MGSSQFSSSSYKLNWTSEQNKRFENALATYDKDIPDRWQKIAKLVSGTNEQEVKKQYEILLHDIKLIESGKVPFPKYRRNGGSTRIKGIGNEEER